MSGEAADSDPMRESTDDHSTTTRSGSVVEPRDRADDESRLHERLRAVERALTGDDRSLTALDDAATASERRDEFDDRITELEDRVSELEAATQALRGYVGSIRAVNREVERRADRALATATEARDGTAPDIDADRPAPAAAIPSGQRADVTVDDVRRAVDDAHRAVDGVETPTDDARETPGDRVGGWNAGTRSGTSTTTNGDGNGAAGGSNGTASGENNGTTGDDPAGSGDRSADGDGDVIARLREVL